MELYLLMPELSLALHLQHKPFTSRMHLEVREVTWVSLGTEIEPGTINISSVLTINMGVIFIIKRQ